MNELPLIMMNAEHVDQIFSEPPTVEERLTAIEERLAVLERQEPAPLENLDIPSQSLYSDGVQFVHISYLNKAEARIAELEAELELEKAKNSGSGINPIKLEPLAIYPL